MNICVYGAASKTIDKKYIEGTEELCELFAKRGHGLVFGGGANGLMGAAARGFERGNAKTIISVVPKFFNVDGILFDKATEYIFTETMRERKAKMEQLSDAFVATPGGVGTLDEFFEIVTLRSLSRHSKPVVLYNLCGYYDPLLAMLKEFEKGEFLKLSEKLFHVSDSAQEAVDFLESYKHEQLDVRQFKNI